MKLPDSQLSHRDLAELFEKSSLKQQSFFPRKVPRLFSLEDKNLPDKKQNKDPSEKPVENS